MSEEKKFTDEVVVKALENCNNEFTDMNRHSCDVCPYKDIEPCGKAQMTDILDLIYRLQSDYSNLKERYVKVLGLNEKVIAEQKAEIERLKINLANEKKWGKIQAKQAEKEKAREILGELDLFFKGTTFRKGYEFKKIDEKLKEMAKNYDVEVDYEN